MPITDSILSGSLLLGQDLTWNGENVLSDLCLYTDESTESSQVYAVAFHLEAIVNLTAVKLFMLQRDRWKAGLVDSNNGLLSAFLNELFNDEETNPSGTTKKALLIQVNNNTVISSYPLKSYIIIYGEKVDTNLFIYAQPLIDDFDFLPIYETSYSLASRQNSPKNPFIGDKENDQEILNDIFGGGEHKGTAFIESSAQLNTPSNKLSELEIIKKMNAVTTSTIDLISDAAEARKSIKMQQHTSHSRISKSKPSKYKSSPSHLHNIPSPSTAPVSVNRGSKTIFEENKSVVKRLINKTLSSTDNHKLQQLIYSSIRYTYGNILNSNTSVDETKLQCIINMHKDFYSNLENIIGIFHPSPTIDK